MIDNLEMMINGFNARNKPDLPQEARDVENMIFDLSSPNKKNPMSYEMMAVITLLKII